MFPDFWRQGLCLFFCVLFWYLLSGIVQVIMKQIAVKNNAEIGLRSSWRLFPIFTMKIFFGYWFMLFHLGAWPQVLFHFWVIIFSLVLLHITNVGSNSPLSFIFLFLSCFTWLLGGVAKEQVRIVLIQQHLICYPIWNLEVFFISFISHLGIVVKWINLVIWLPKSQILALLVLSCVTLANDLTSLVLSLRGSWESHLNFPCLNFCAAFCVVDWAPPPPPPSPSKSTICIILQKSREKYFADFSCTISG